jgi:hypothetical protein
MYKWLRTLGLRLKRVNLGVAALGSVGLPHNRGRVGDGAKGERGGRGSGGGGGDRKALGMRLGGASNTRRG